MILVDSVGWIAYLVGDALGARYRPLFTASDPMICSALNIYEVCRRIEVLMGDRAAALALSQMQKTTVIPVDQEVATYAATLSINHHLSLADAVIYATAQAYEATLITSDEHFRGLPGVTMITHPNVSAPADGE
jgi:predicted nucleic acid-binding protein